MHFSICSYANLIASQWKQGVPVEVAPFAYAKVLHNLRMLGSTNPKLRMARGLLDKLTGGAAGGGAAGGALGGLLGGAAGGAAGGAGGAAGANAQGTKTPRDQEMAQKSTASPSPPAGGAARILAAALDNLDAAALAQEQKEKGKETRRGKSFLRYPR